MCAERSRYTDERLNQLNVRLQEAVACLSRQLDDVEWHRLFEEIIELRTQQFQLMEAKNEELKRPATRQPD
jgi:hypothetical protein